jgi:RNA polymerase sigma-70 factor (ECF subfamily)
LECETGGFLSRIILRNGLDDVGKRGGVSLIGPFFLVNVWGDGAIALHAGGYRQHSRFDLVGESKCKMEFAVFPSEGDSPDTPKDSSHGPPPDQFVMWITAAQRPLYAYIRTLIGPCAEVDDVLQEVNLVLWRKAAEYDGRGQFLTWACHIAYLQVLAQLKRRQRDKHVYFDEAVLADLAEPLARHVESLEDRVEALRRCLQQLSPQHRRMITARYTAGGSVQKLALELGRSAGSVRVALHRIRALLLACMQRQLSTGASS